MSKVYTYIEEGRVREVIQPFIDDVTNPDEPRNVSIEERYPADFVEHCVVVPEGTTVSDGAGGRRPVAANDSYVEGVFGPPPVLKPLTPQFPAEVSMRQARLALLAAEKLNAVAVAIADLPSPQRETAQIEWDYSSTVARDSQIVALLGPALGLDKEALDALFLAAAAL